MAIKHKFVDWKICFYLLSEHILGGKQLGVFVFCFFGLYHWKLYQFLFNSGLFVDIWWHLMATVTDQVQLMHKPYPVKPYPLLAHLAVLSSSFMTGFWVFYWNIS